MAEDLSVKDIVGHIFGFEEVPAGFSVGVSQVARFPKEFEAAESCGNVFGGINRRQMDSA
jgi:hypothetical protein